MIIILFVFPARISAFSRASEFPSHTFIWQLANREIFPKFTLSVNPFCLAATTRFAATKLLKTFRLVIRQRF